MIPGLPDRRYRGLQAWLLPLKTYTFLRQLHNARRAGLHLDIRIGNPMLGLLSWASKKGMPHDLLKRLWITQPLHTFPYKDFHGQIKSKYGYGTVLKLLLSPVVILLNTPLKIKFTRADKRNADIYTMVKTKNGNFLTTVQSATHNPVIKSYLKLHFQNIPLDQVADLLDQGAKVTPKADGAGALAEIKPHGVDVYGVRKDKDGNLIRYTDHIGGLRGLNVPPLLVGKVLRVLVAGLSLGKPIKVNQLSGLLNSNLGTNILSRKQNKVNMFLYALAQAGKKDDYNRQAVLLIVNRLNTDKIRMLPEVTKENYSRQLLLMRQKKHPITNEGFVVIPKNKRPLKAKLTLDADVIIRDIFPAETTGKMRAGGFSYSLPGSLQIVGRVGSGLDFKVLQHMLEHPLLYKNKTAKIEAQLQYLSGAFRAPRFVAMRPEGD